MKYCIAIGTHTSMFKPLLFGGDLVESIKKAGTIGYDAVELNVPDIFHMDKAAVKQACEEQNMLLTTLATGAIYGTHGLTLTDPDPARCEELVGMVKDYIDLAVYLGSGITIGSIKGNIKKDEDRPKYLDILGKNLQKISRYAVEKRVTVFLEDTNRLENNVLNTGQSICQMIEEYDLKNFKLLLDSFHVNIEEDSVGDCIRNAKKHLGYIHFGDNNRWYPGAGCFRFDEFNQAIKDIGYDGVLSVECFPMPDQETAARKSYEFFKKNFG